MKLKTIVANLSLLSVSILLVLLVAEAASRYMVPISPGPKLQSLSGEPLKHSYIKPGSEYRIITPDYDAPTRITADAYRAPEAIGNPDTVFLGDSFTFGQGVKDDEAFPAIYCKAKKLSCANLAVPGSSTLYELDRLESVLKNKGWTPNNVFLFFFTGNDFSDNLAAAEKRDQGLSYEPPELRPDVEAQRIQNLSLLKRVVNLTLHYSNLMRVLYYQVLPDVRQQQDPDAHKNSFNKALSVSEQAFKRLDRLSNEYAFNYRIFVLYPESEVRQKAYFNIRKSLQSISPTKLISLGELYAQDVEGQYFPSDGHLTVKGNKTLADFLIEQR